MTLGQANRQIERLITRYQARFPKAIARALNRAGTSTRALMASKTASDMGLKVGTVRDEIKIERATENKPIVRLRVSGKRIPLIEFRARGPEPSRGRGRGVTARLPAPGAGRYPHAFIATTRSGHRGVFERYDAAGRAGQRGPRGGRVYQLHGPSIPKVFNKYTPEGLARGEESLKKNLVHELRFAVSQT
jgi:hypothetical protein